jgi:aryl-alcohol dehydrogenase-like predicted oxidoreductase
MKSVSNLSRRHFLQLTAFGALGSLIAPLAAQQTAEPSPPRITLGGIVRASAIALGGWALAEALSEEAAIDLINHALDKGITFFDTAPTYGKHSTSEKRLGKALGERRRYSVLSSKTYCRDAVGAKADLEGSLERLNTSFLDIWMFHEVATQEDVMRITSKGGALEAAREALAQGTIRLLGASGHHSPTVLNSLMEKVPELHVLQCPINCLDAHQNSFLLQTLPMALERKVSVIGTAPLAQGMVDHVGTITKEKALAFALSQPVSAWCPTITNKEDLDTFINAFETLKRLSLEEQEDILEETASFAGITYEHYKNWNR